MESRYSFKDLENVVIKATSKIEIDGRTIEPNETIAAFDKVMISSFQDKTSVVTAHGGFGDTDRVWWENTKEVDLTFSEGIFSSQQLALLLNSKFIICF